MSLPDSSRRWIWTIAACSAVATACSLLSSWYCYDDHKAEDDGEGIPDSFRDPITFDLIREPVVLCATGQVYDLAGLRQWFAEGHYRCPRTNLDVFNAQVTRLPWLKQSICNWLNSHGRPLPPEPHPSLAEIKAIHPQIAMCIRNIRAATGTKCAQAVALLAHLLRDWQDNTAAAGGAGAGVALQQQAAVRSAVMEDMLWLLRYAADDDVKASAAAVLFCCGRDDELGWLAAAGSAPLVAMLYSSDSTAQQWALQVLYKVCIRVPASRILLWHVGCVEGLLHLLSLDKAHVAFHRDRAAVALATMAELPAVRDWLREHAVVPLMALLLCSSDRWEQRDAAFALMALQLQQQDLQAAAATVLAREASMHHAPALVPGSSRLADAAGTAAGAAGAISCAAGAAGAACYGAGCGASTAVSHVDAVHGVSECSSSNAAAQTSNAAVRSHANSVIATGPGVLLQRQCAVQMDWHGLLATYRWCSQEYLEGQVDEPDAGLTDEEKAARQQCEAALVRYRQALQRQQQQQDMLHRPMWMAQEENFVEGRPVLQLHRQQQQQQHHIVHEQLHGEGQHLAAPQPQQLHLQMQERTMQQPLQLQQTASHMQQQVLQQQAREANSYPYQQQGQQHAQQHAQQQPLAPLQHHPNHEQIPVGIHVEQRHEHQQQQPQQQRPHQRHGQQHHAVQPRHWMAEHDADGDSGAADGAGMLWGLAGSNGSSSSSSDGIESDSDSSAAFPSDCRDHAGSA